MLKDFSFPPLQLRPLVTEKSQEEYRERAVRLNRNVDGTGASGRGYLRRKEELRRAGPRNVSVMAVMTRPSYIRPLIDLWAHSESFRASVPPNRVLFDHIERLTQKTGRQRLTRLPLRELCLLFFRLYDNVEQIGALGQLLCRQLGRYRKQELMFGLDRLLECRERLLTDQGHVFLAHLAEGRRMPLKDVAEQYGISLDSRFFERCQQVYYIHRLKALAPNQDDPLLREVRSPEVFEQYLDRPRRLGHAVLSILIDTLRNAGEKPGDLWMDTLLAIGGDPRHMASSFQLWWEPLGESYFQCMYEWLSEVDLDLFLQICREYIGSSDREEMQRMYPDREKFLHMLFDRKLIRKTRLFLGYRVQDYVASNYVDRQKPFSTQIKGDPDLAVFYLDLGRAHVVEGTFNFTLKIMDRLPPKSILARYDNVVPGDALRKRLEEKYVKAFQSEKNLYSFRHKGDWMDRAIDALFQLGVMY